MRNMLVDMLLIGGPLDGEVRQIDPDLEDGFTEVNARTDERHDYVHVALDPHESLSVYNVGLHAPLLDENASPEDAAMFALSSRYAK
jgi:hypothetical protein